MRAERDGVSAEVFTGELGCDLGPRTPTTSGRVLHALCVRHARYTRIAGVLLYIAVATLRLPPRTDRRLLSRGASMHPSKTSDVTTLVIPLPIVTSVVGVAITEGA